MRLEILEPRELILVIQLILWDGMQARAFIKGFQRQMHDHFTLHIMKVTQDLKRKPIEKNNG